MGNLPLSVIGLLLGSTMAQVLGVYLMPLNKGFTVLLPSLGTLACFMTGVVLLSRALVSGANISTSLPLVSAAIPLFAIFVGIFVYGDPASLPKIGLLVGACVAIIVASYI